MKEIWKSVPGYSRLYEISSIGRIRYRKSGRLRKLQLNRKGYPFLILYDHGRFTGHEVHRLVLLAFVGACPKNKEASHIDGNRANSNLSNLLWETHMENMKRAIDMGRTMTGEKNGNHKLKRSDVSFIRDCKPPYPFAKRNRRGKTARELAERFGVSSVAITDIWSCKTWVTSSKANTSKRACGNTGL